MTLSKRLQAVSSLVSPGKRLADIGTDHGYVPISLVESGRIPMAIAMDVREGPLNRAREHIRIAGLEDRIQTRLSDGMEQLMPGEVDTVLIAGMGGALMVRILEGGERLFLPPGKIRDGLSSAEKGAWISELVLQPQSEVSKVRRYLADHFFRIEWEDMVLEDGKYYPMMRARRGEMHLGELEVKYGPSLLKMQHPILRSYLSFERGTLLKAFAGLQKSVSEKAAAQREDCLHALRLNREAAGRTSFKPL